MFARNLSGSPEKQIVSAMKKPVGREGSRGGVGQKETTSNGTRKAIHGNAM